MWGAIALERVDNLPRSPLLWTWMKQIKLKEKIHIAFATSYLYNIPFCDFDFCNFFEKKDCYFFESCYARLLRFGSQLKNQTSQLLQALIYTT